jgi:hypothetical protein
MLSKVWSFKFALDPDPSFVWSERPHLPSPVNLSANRELTDFQIIIFDDMLSLIVWLATDECPIKSSPARQLALVGFARMMKP